MTALSQSQFVVGLKNRPRLFKKAFLQFSRLLLKLIFAAVFSLVTSKKAAQVDIYNLRILAFSGSSALNTTPCLLFLTRRRYSLTRNAKENFRKKHKNIKA